MIRTQLTSKLEIVPFYIIPPDLLWFSGRLSDSMYIGETKYITSTQTRSWRSLKRELLRLKTTAIRGKYRDPVNPALVCMRPVSPLNVGQVFQLASLCSTDTRICQEELLQTALTALGELIQVFNK